MREKKLNSQSGITIIEVLIVVVVMAIVAAFAVTQLGRSKIDFQRQRIAREFKVYLERARFDSVKRRAAVSSDMSRVILNSATSFTVVADFNQNGTLLKSDGTVEDGDRRVVDFTDRSEAQIVVSNTLNYPVTILYNQRGHITATDGLNNPVNPVFTICSNNCSAASPEATVISVSTTGTVAVLKSGETPGALPTPSAVSNAAPQFNCYVLVNSNVSANSIPAPCINK